MRFYQSVSFRIWVIFTLVGLGLSIPLATYYNEMQFSLLQKHTQEEFKQNSMVTSNAIKTAIEQDDYKMLNNLLSDLNDIESFELVAIIEKDESGRPTVFACNPESFKNKVLNKDTVNYFYNSTPFESELLNGEVVIAYSKAKDLVILKELNRPLIYLTIAALLASAFLFGFSISFLSRPIFKAVEIAKALGQREYSVQILQTNGKDEISSLNNSLFQLRSDLLKLDKHNRELVNTLELKILEKTVEIDNKNKFNNLLLRISRIFLESNNTDKNEIILQTLAEISHTLNHKDLGIFSLEHEIVSCQYINDRSPLFLALKGAKLGDGIKGTDDKELLFFRRGDGSRNQLCEKIFNEINEANSLYLKLFMDDDGVDELFVIISESSEKEEYFNEFEDMINVFFSLYRNFKKSKSFESDLISLNQTLEKKVLEKTQTNLDISNTLIAQDKLATIGELSAGVAHDLNTPLAAVKAASQNIRGVLEDLVHELKTLSKGDLVYVLSEPREYPEYPKELGGLQKITKTREIHEFLKEKGFSGEAEIFARNLIESGLDFENKEIITSLIELSDPLASLKVIKKRTEINLFLNIIDSSVNRSSLVIKNLSMFTKEDLTQLREPVDLQKSIEIVESLFKFRLSGKIQLITDVLPNSFISGIEMKLFQVWTNIVKNAIDALEHSEKENKYIRIYSETLEDTVIVYFENNGPKISEENIQRIFKKFFTTKQKINGTGLGLSIVSNIVAEHYGKVSLTSDDHKTVFSIVFPRLKTEKMQD